MKRQRANWSSEQEGEFQKLRELRSEWKHQKKVGEFVGRWLLDHSKPWKFKKKPLFPEDMNKRLIDLFFATKKYQSLLMFKQTETRGHKGYKIEYELGESSKYELRDVGNGIEHVGWGWNEKNPDDIATLVLKFEKLERKYGENMNCCDIQEFFEINSEEEGETGEVKEVKDDENKQKQKDIIEKYDFFLDRVVCFLATANWEDVARDFKRWSDDFGGDFVVAE